MILNFLKPRREKLNTFLGIGIPLIALSFVDFFSNSFLGVNITGFLPEMLSYFFPLIIGAIGLYLIRIEFSGVRLLDKFNKNVKIFFKKLFSSSSSCNSKSKRFCQMSFAVLFFRNKNSLSSFSSLKGVIGMPLLSYTPNE